MIYWNHVYLMKDFDALTSGMDEGRLEKAVQEGEKDNLFNPNDMFFILLESADFNVSEYSWMKRGNDSKDDTEPYDSSLVTPEKFISFNDDNDYIWSRVFAWTEDDVINARNAAREKWLESGKPRPRY